MLNSALSCLSQAVSEVAECWVQVKTKDGRLLVGELSCLDKQGNIILSHTVQILISGSNGAQVALYRLLQCVDRIFPFTPS